MLDMTGSETIVSGPVSFCDAAGREWTRDKSPWHIARALDNFGIDYATQPFETVELPARVHAPSACGGSLT